MVECRFYGECRLCGGLSPRECDGKGMITTLSAVGYVYNKCGRFSPMPDKDALLGLADEIERVAAPDMGINGDTTPAWYAAARLKNVASRIRKAFGEAEA